MNNKISEKNRKIICKACLAMAVVLIVAGACAGGMKEVFSNAAGLCLKCIGIG
ncbi:MAG: hypothetical protein HUJ70_15620 [Pseudobutyrivibrio sp.]|nr:hypothetical protein [Pseudobutyrivibrio sp.]